MTVSEDKKLKQDNAKKNKGNKKGLPWWVELLFVQIGLPEDLLRKWLQTKVHVKDHINNQKNKYLITLFTISIAAYVSPIVKESMTRNTCVKETKTFLTDNNIIKNKQALKAQSVSVNHCNGGNYLSSKLVD